MTVAGSNAGWTSRYTEWGTDTLQKTRSSGIRTTRDAYGDATGRLGFGARAEENRPRLVNVARSEGRDTMREVTDASHVCDPWGVTRSRWWRFGGFLTVDLARADDLDACHVSDPCAPPMDCAWPNQITAPQHPDLLWLGSNGNKVQNLKLYVISIKSIY